MSDIKIIKDLEELRDSIETIDTDFVLILVDANVYNIYRKKFDFLNFKSKKVAVWKCLEGERTKSYDELKNALEFFLSKKAHRNAHLVAFGGGAASDFGGLVASMLLRGVKWSVIPTSLLGMIDAAVGGKVAINSEHGKNLVGAFHLPENVFIFQDFLETLPDINILGGKGEMLKYCFLSKKINEAILSDSSLSEIIELCARYKQEIVDADFKEGGKRKILNLGHTLGHAFERIYELEHGIAVFWGMVVMFYIFEDEEDLVNLRALVDKLELNFGDSPWFNKTFPVEDIMNYIRNDKKASSVERLDIVRLDGLGQPVIENVLFTDIENKLSEKKDELRKFIL